MQPELDIVVCGVVADDTAESSKRARQVFASAAKRNLHLALIELPAELFCAYALDVRANTETVTCLRSVMMKPEQLDWLPEITAILEAAATEL